MSRLSHTALCVTLAAALTLTACAPVEQLLEDLADDALEQNGIVILDEVDRDDPFGGTEAEGYAEGFDVPGEIDAVGPYPQARVREAYELTRELMEAVYLNQDAVFDEDNSEFTALLTPQSLDWYLENHGHEDPEIDTRYIPFNLTPGTAEPIGDVVKVDGRMWAEEASDPNGLDYLAVRTEYTIVHPVARPGDPASVRLVTSHLGEVSFYDMGDGTWELWPYWTRSVGPAHCLDQHTWTPAYPDELPRGDRPEGRPEDPYDLDNAREDAADPDGGECGAIKGT
ncbi:hypothetical protein [Nocardiopsis lucentensis]|uniref:hypothetical protein n=1 Tax=Nocardiopsis lucentensis TaxID=53441 RepID=UPI00034C6AE6|nr:hypothetical protein [Nocardiopsis lucentensis]